jgi:hypothetical protein
MLKSGDLGGAFRLYWNDLDRCRQAGAFFALLHATVCLPDICSALESSNGESSGPKYMKWCDRYFRRPELVGAERWTMRCKVLHQGRATAGRAGRYTGFLFGEPDPSGAIDHLRVDGSRLHVDVSQLYGETREAVEDWIAALESDPRSAESETAAKHLPLLVRVSPHKVPVATAAGSAFVVSNRTN